MTIVRVGTTPKYSDNWAKAFGKGKKAAAAPAAEKAPAKKKSAAKPAPKKKAGKKGKK